MSRWSSIARLARRLVEDVRRQPNVGDDVPGDPLADIGVTEDVRFVMKGGQVYRHDNGDA